MKVLAFVPDLMDRSRLRSTETVSVELVGLDELPARVMASAPDVLVLDVSRPGAIDALASVPASVKVVGFGPHVDDELLAAAQAAGCDVVLPRSRFFARWPDVLPDSWR